MVSSCLFLFLQAFSESFAVTLCTFWHARRIGGKRKLSWSHRACQKGTRGPAAWLPAVPAAPRGSAGLVHGSGQGEREGALGGFEEDAGV